MQHQERGLATGCPRRSARSRLSGTLALSALVTAAGAVLLGGCAATEELPRSMGMRVGPTPPAAPNLAGQPMSAPTSSNVQVTPRQHRFLDALTAAGVHRSNDLHALSVGSYVCQARAAGQSDQAVWDFVFPLVRGDVHESDRAAPTRSVQQTTAEYIRIATEQLC